MKNKKSFFKLIIIIFAFLLVCTVCLLSFVDSDKLSAYLSFVSFSDEFSSSNMPISMMNFNKLNQAEKKAYISIFNAVEKHPTYIKIPKLTNEEFNNVYFAVKNDNPDILCFSDTCNMISFMSQQFVEISYSASYAECQKMKAGLNEKIEAIIADCNCQTDYEKEKYVHDYIVSNCEYAETQNSSNAYGCLIEKKAVCSGYSRAAMLLLDKLDVVSYLVTGVGISPTQGRISHMWNAVWIDGIPYHLDITWNDPVGAKSSDISYLYFNLNTEQILRDHQDLSYGTDFTDTTYNFFERNGVLFDDYNAKTLKSVCKALVSNINDGLNYIEFQFTNKDAYDKAVQSIIDNNSYTSHIYEIVKYVGDYSERNVDTTHVNFSKLDAKYYIKIMFDEV